MNIEIVSARSLEVTQ